MQVTITKWQYVFRIHSIVEIKNKKPNYYGFDFETNFCFGFLAADVLAKKIQRFLLKSESYDSLVIDVFYLLYYRYPFEQHHAYRHRIDFFRVPDIRNYVVFFMKGTLQ